MNVVYLKPRNSYSEGLIRAAIEEITKLNYGNHIGCICWMPGEGAVLQDVEVVERKEGEGAVLQDVEVVERKEGENSVDKLRVIISSTRSMYTEDNDSTKNSYPWSKLEKIARKYKLKVDTVQIDREEKPKKKRHGVLFDS